MAKTTSKTKKTKSAKKTTTSKDTKKTAIAKSVEKPVVVEKEEVFKHKSFRRSYREDYARELNVPGMMQHIVETFKMIFKNWKLFLPLLILSVVMSIVLAGLMSEDTYRQFQNVLDQTSEQTGAGEIGGFAKAGLLLISTVTSGGLSAESSGTTMVFSVLIFLMIWLVSCFFVRQRMAKREIKFRDGIYNAMTPLMATLVLFVLVIIECIPIILLIIAYSAALKTEFLSTPFYALLFFAFAMLMILISSYLLSSTMMAFVAVTAPGMYPLPALSATNELMRGRRIRTVLRMVSLIIALIVIWAVVMLPLILFDLFMKQFDWTSYVPFIPFCLVVMTSATEIFVSVYFYLYYRWMLEA